MHNIALMLLLALPVAAGALEVTGTVWSDENDNGLRDPGEGGLGGVRVSNGRDIVTTLADGSYRIAIDDRGGHVMVLKPRNYRWPLNEAGTPRFYYLHAPDGSPDLRYGGLAPSGELPESVNFRLVPAEESDDFRVLVLADPQVGDDLETDYFRRLFGPELKGDHGADLVVVLGDLVDDHLDLFDDLDAIMGLAGVPWVPVVGNHDLDLDAPDDRHARDTFKSRYGPTTWAFRFGPVHFLVLDNIRFRGTPGGGHEYVGGLREDDFVFIAQYLSDLPDDSFVVAMMHIPLTGGNANGFSRQHRRRLLRLLDRFDYSLSLAGHSHSQRHHRLGYQAGWRGRQPHHHYVVGTASGAWWGGETGTDGLPEPVMRDGTPPGYALIDFSRDGYWQRYRPVGRHAGERIALFGPGTIMAGTYPNAYVYVNVFNGDDETMVEYRIDGEGWRPMQRVEEPDPRVLARVLDRARMTGRPTGPRLSAPIPSTHLWKARLSTLREPGVYRMQVRMTDRYAQHHAAATIFEVVPRGTRKPGDSRPPDVMVEPDAADNPETRDGSG